MLFADIPGLQPTKDQLTQAVKSGKIAHAQLFQGRPGALNLPLALAYTTYLHCQNKKDGDACGQCAACSKSLKYIHPDTNFVFPSGNLKGDMDDDQYRAERLKSWRAFLTEQPFGSLNEWISYHGGENKAVNISKEESREIIKALSLKPFESTYKVMVIWQPEYMHPNAANGILKILEEPPPQTIFLLVTNAAEQLLPTIVSRTQSIQVPLLNDDDLDNYLAKSIIDLDERKRSKVVQFAEGDLAKALSLIETDEDHHHEVFASWMRACFRKDYQAMVALSEDFHELDRLSKQNLLEYGLTMMRETLLQVAGAEAINRAKGAELTFARNFSTQLSVRQIEKVSSHINEAGYFLERNGSAKMIFLDLSLQISKIMKP